MALVQGRLFAWTPCDCHEGLRPGISLDMQVDERWPVLNLQQNLLCEANLLVLQ
jgi:hypothetical protein